MSYVPVSSVVAEMPVSVVTVAPETGSWVAESVTSPAMSPCGPVVSASTPFGVPRPVGPSQPGPAWHSTLPHPPLVPSVTSKRAPGLSYGYDAGLVFGTGVPARAYIEAMRGED